MAEKRSDGRKKIKTDPTAEYVKYICDLYGDRYDDQDEDSKPFGADWRPGEQSKHLSLEGFRKKLLGVYGVELSTAKIRKILITGECWSTERSREVQREYEKLQSIPLVAQKLKLTVACVSMNLPYEKVVYDLENKSGNAKRVEKWRKNHKNDLDIIDKTINK